MAQTNPGEVTPDSTDELELMEEIEDAVRTVESEGLHGYEALHAVMDMLRSDYDPALEHAVATHVWQRLSDPEAEHVGLTHESHATTTPPLVLMEEVEEAVRDVQAEGLTGRAALVEATQRVAEAMGDDAHHGRIVAEVRARMVAD